MCSPEESEGKRDLDQFSEKSVSYIHIDWATNQYIGLVPSTYRFKCSHCKRASEH